MSLPTPVPIGVGAGLSLDVEYIKPREQLLGGRRILVYPVKFICGFIPNPSGPPEATLPPGEEPPLKPANYATAINVINLTDHTISFNKKAVIALPEGEHNNPIIGDKITETLLPNAALEIDCNDIVNNLLYGKNLPPVTLLKGFVVIEIPKLVSCVKDFHPLEVVAIYTALHKQFVLSSV
ncbi:hypothetical protein [Carboxydothermus pertinax]|uniref:Uncharacterized protein n=1 Tax=Carboxydothermus pertinax TaxID=870242 RepID=A0A1L8CTF9_9THEO|nr:hypothetical protein [Carboxydothermus pertinax]GAV22134.1 hypothetical protein cpu_06440 [Carboxydothermus pertinax]